MTTVNDVAVRVRHLTGNMNLGLDRIVSWLNMVVADVVTNIAGNGTMGAEIASVEGFTTTPPYESSGTEGLYGRWALATTSLAAASEFYSITSNGAMSASNPFPQDVILLRQIFHGSVSAGTADGLYSAGGVARLRYMRETPEGLAKFVEGRLYDETVDRIATEADIRYAVAGGIFGNTSGATYTNSYGVRLGVFPHPGYQTSRSWMIVDYVKAPAKFTSGAPTQSDVFLTKHPDVVLNGVLRYAFLYLGDIENYLLARKAFEDGLSGVVGAGRVQMHVPVMRGAAM